MDQERPARTALDALHLELLGTLVDISAHVQSLKSELPALQGEVAQTLREAQQAFDEMRASSMALVGWVKNKQAETLGELGKAHAENLSQTQKVFRAHDRFLWTLVVLSTLNLLLLIVVLLQR